MGSPPPRCRTPVRSGPGEGAAAARAWPAEQRARPRPRLASCACGATSTATASWCTHGRHRDRCGRTQCQQHRTCHHHEARPRTCHQHEPARTHDAPASQTEGGEPDRSTPSPQPPPTQVKPEHNRRAWGHDVLVMLPGGPARGRAHVCRWHSCCNRSRQMSSRSPTAWPPPRQMRLSLGPQHVLPGHPGHPARPVAADPSPVDPGPEGGRLDPGEPPRDLSGRDPLDTPGVYHADPSPPVPARATSTAHPRALAHSSGSSTRPHAGRQHTTCSSAPATRGGRTTSERHPHPGQRMVVTRWSGSSTGHRADALDAAGPRSASMSATHGIPAHSSSSDETQDTSTPTAPGSRTPTTSASLDQTSPVTGSAAAHASVTHKPDGRGARTPRASATCPHQDASTATRSSATPSASGYRHLGPAARPAPDPPDGDDTDGAATSNR